MNNQEIYFKKIKKRKLSYFPEYSALNLAWGASLIIALIAMLGCYNKQTGSINIGFSFIFGTIYLVSGIIMYFMCKKMSKDILDNNQISKFIEKLGYLCIALVSVGNIFAAIAGFRLIEKNKTIEYTLSYCAVINSVFIILLSIINIFKPYVSVTYFLGMVLLTAGLLLQIIALVMTKRAASNKIKYRSLKLISYLMILTAVSGNLFALLLGMAILAKLKNEDSKKTIEWIDILKRVFRNYMSVLGLFLVIFLITLSICTLITFEYSYAIDNDYSSLLKEPSIVYPFGTDPYGRCVYTRIAFGAQISLFVGILSTALPILIGGTLGAIAGYYGDRLDNTTMRLLDVLYAVPSMLLAIAIVAAFGASTFNLILALSIGVIPVYARTLRAQVMVVSSSEFVEAARACGRKEYEILIKHIIPNSLAPIIVRASISIGGAVLSTSSLSYLGLGVEPHIPEWGNILKIGSSYLETNPYIAIYPGLAIILVVLAFNFLGDGLRDALDPKLK